MRVYIICPVRNGTPVEVLDYVKKLESEGHLVHFPPRDVDQDDLTGLTICSSHLRALIDSDEVHVFWDVNSKGSHFDYGMAFALRKIIRIVKLYQEDTPGKSYVKVMLAAGLKE